MNTTIQQPSQKDLISAIKQLQECDSPFWDAAIKYLKAKLFVIYGETV